jgi:hypothetical protein
MASLPDIMLEGIQRLSSKNYNMWKQHMLTIFEYRSLVDIILGKDTQPTTMGKD